MENRIFKTSREDSIEARSRVGQNVTFAGILIHVVLIIFKLIGGILGRSQAMIADAVHSISDLVTDFIALIGLAFSAKPHDPKHPYGHGKIETFASLLIGLMLIAVAGNISLDGFRSIMKHSRELPTGIALAAAIISIVIKEFLYHWNIRVGRRIESQLMIANAWHHRTDAISSVAAFIGIGGAMLGYTYLDPLAAIIVSIIIIASSFPIVKNAFLELIETSVDIQLLERIEFVIRDQDEVIEFSNLRARQVGKEILVDVNIGLDESLPLMKSHSIAHNIEDKIIAQIKGISEVMIHVFPVGAKSYREIERELINKCGMKVKTVPGVKGYHDLLVHRRDNMYHVNIHIEVDPGMDVTQGDKISHQVEEKLKECYPVIKQVHVHTDPKKKK